VWIAPDQVAIYMAAPTGQGDRSIEEIHLNLPWEYIKFFGLLATVWGAIMMAIGRCTLAFGYFRLRVKKLWTSIHDQTIFGKVPGRQGYNYHGFYKQGLSLGKGEGLGIADMINGDKMLGEWSNGSIIESSGYITITANTVSINQTNDKIGFGQTIINRNSVYQGDYCNGFPNGFGVYLHLEKGICYKGYWAECHRHGLGKLKLANGDIFYGQWDMDQLHGRAKVVFANGDSFLGAFKVGLIDGEGEWIWENGNMYKGSWKNGKKHGDGISTTSKNAKFKEVWVNGTRKSRKKLF
jgi:hypothetical protein